MLSIFALLVKGTVEIQNIIENCTCLKNPHIDFLETSTYLCLYYMSYNYSCMYLMLPCMCGLRVIKLELKKKKEKEKKILDYIANFTTT